MNLKMRVLVVDDMAVMRKMVTKILKGLGFETIDNASDGKEAWDKIEGAINDGSPYEFIVSDWNMPNMSGLELLQKMRSKDSTKKVPFLMVTAEGEKENLVTAIKAGVTNFVVKPFTPATLGEKIKKIFPG